MQSLGRVVFNVQWILVNVFIDMMNRGGMALTQATRPGAQPFSIPYYATGTEEALEYLEWIKGNLSQSV